MGYLGNSLGVAFSSYKLIDSLTASFNGTTTSFALTVNGVTPVPFPLNEQNILISVGGVPQKPDPTGAEGFSFSGSNIVFSSAPKTGEAFWGVILAGADRVNAGVQYPDGSASAPSITFISQPTTGLYRPGSGVLGFTTLGLARGVIDSNGNWGIGTTVASSGRLTVSGNSINTPVALTDAATIATDLSLANYYTLTLGGNRTLGAPTNQTAGQSGVIVITQDGTGSRTLVYNSVWKFPNGTVPTLTTTANAVDVLCYYVESGTRITARLLSDVK